MTTPYADPLLAWFARHGRSRAGRANQARSGSAEGVVLMA